MKKSQINMLSSATSVKGQGVGSAYIEQVNLVKDGLADEFDIFENALKCSEITHYHTIDFKFAISKWFMTKNGKSVGYVHMLPETVENSLNLPKPIKKIFFWYMIKFYKSMDYLVTVNPYFIGELEKYGIDRNKVTYIPNYVSGDDFYKVSKDEKERLREKYGIDKDAFVVLSAGQLQTRKGIFDVLKMAEQLPDIQFVWAGGFSFGKISDGYKEIEKVVDNPPHNVKFLGIVDREYMNEVYNLADVMLLASFEELFPMTILEAMCVNTPILLRDLEIYEDILFDFYEKANSIDTFVSVLNRLKQDESYYEQAQQASAKGNIFYAKDNVLSMWKEFYEQVEEQAKQEN
ncbi:MULTISPECIES: glycosyltransferase [unclassified Granulicatella]|uniref:glycosyltransferase family 4 protein n=1 Tax=Granulicatella sp. zg-84 TaxID=2678503 RepID=UPI001F073335|nr:MULTISPECIES: glycosyltransferase [unclassified Granulicatella]